MTCLIGAEDQLEASASWNPPYKYVSDVKSKEEISWEYLLSRNNPDISFDGSSSMAILIDSDLSQLRNYPVNIKFTQFGKVFEYLLQYPNLSKLIKETCIDARAEFGPEAQLSLDFEQDPEFDQPSLTLYIRQKKYADDIMDRIDLFRSRFTDEIVKSSGDYFITTDFQNPR
jgi:hypothetical protein